MRHEALTTPIYPARRLFVLGLFVLAMLGLLVRAVDLQVFKREFLQGQGDARHLRVVSTPAHRGMIVDRNAEPLAISTPVDSIWVNPQEAAAARETLPALARLLGMSRDDLFNRLAQRSQREFVYLRRHVNPDLARQVMALQIPGVSLQREYRRYYPMGEVAAHVLGFTNIDDRGQEGLELGFDEWLAGVPGARRVIRDRLGRAVDDVENIRSPRPGKTLTLSLDRRLQYLAYRELKSAVAAHNAVSGSVVIMDPHTGDVLAMVNQPAYNPNNRKGLRSGVYRNRAVTDVFEPGSTIKPLALAAAMKTGRYTPTTLVDTTPGLLRVGSHTIRDVRNYGAIDLTTVIRKSSNVGASKIALSLEPKQLWSFYTALGLGRTTGSGFPGESAGVMTDSSSWSEVERATLAFGYGLSVTPLQLAQAYSAFANDGVVPQAGFLKDREGASGQRVMSALIARETRMMLEQVVRPGGSGTRAAVRGYRVAGKTGTARKSSVGGYVDDRYVAVFAGLAPVSDPQLVVVVMINEPRRGGYYGGVVAAPVFSRVMSESLRLLDVPPDDLHELQAGVAEPAAEVAG